MNVYELSLPKKRSLNTLTTKRYVPKIPTEFQLNLSIEKSHIITLWTSQRLAITIQNDYSNTLTHTLSLSSYHSLSMYYTEWMAHHELCGWGLFSTSEENYAIRVLFNSLMLVDVESGNREVLSPPHKSRQQIRKRTHTHTHSPLHNY